MKKDRRYKWHRHAWKHWEDWQHDYGPPPWVIHRRPKKRGSCLILFGFLVIFGFIALLTTGGVGALTYLATYFIEEGWQTNPEYLFLGLGLAAGLPLLALIMGTWARRRIADPIAHILDAADAVGAGDLSVRVPENRRSTFYTLERSFNRMLSELERADIQRRNLTADVAHELRTPIHVIQGYLEGVLDGVYEPDEETINTLLDETQLLSRLVEDLRTLSLAEAGELQLQVEEVDLAELIADVHTSFSGQAEAAGITLTTEVADGLSLTADPGRLDQVLGNLVVNALRYTGEGGEVTIRAEGEGDGCRIVVEDTGEGIAAEDLPFVFDRFWRADKSRTNADGSGHGLGLAIARQLVRAHGGEIEVESEVGVGSKFIIRLPKTLG
jgi:signal transduction histidine kinase